MIIEVLARPVSVAPTTSPDSRPSHSFGPAPGSLAAVESLGGVVRLDDGLDHYSSLCRCRGRTVQSVYRTCHAHDRRPFTDRGDRPYWCRVRSRRPRPQISDPRRRLRPTTRSGRAKGLGAVTLEAFFEQLGLTQGRWLEAISMDFGAPYAKALAENAQAWRSVRGPVPRLRWPRKLSMTPGGIGGRPQGRPRRGEDVQGHDSCC